MWGFNKGKKEFNDNEDADFVIHTMQDDIISNKDSSQHQKSRSKESRESSPFFSNDNYDRDISSVNSKSSIKPLFSSKKDKKEISFSKSKNDSPFLNEKESVHSFSKNNTNDKSLIFSSDNTSKGKPTKVISDNKDSNNETVFDLGNDYKFDKEIKEKTKNSDIVETASFANENKEFIKNKFFINKDRDRNQDKSDSKVSNLNKVLQNKELNTKPKNIVEKTAFANSDVGDNIKKSSIKDVRQINSKSSDKIVTHDVIKGNNTSRIVNPYANLSWGDNSNVNTTIDSMDLRSDSRNRFSIGRFIKMFFGILVFGGIILSAWFLYKDPSILNTILNKSDNLVKDAEKVIKGDKKEKDEEFEVVLINSSSAVDDFSKELNRIADMNFNGIRKINFKNNSEDVLNFRTFCSLVDFKISEDILKNLGDEFSVYVHNIGGDIRYSLLVDVKDESNLKQVLKKEEEKLLNYLERLYTEPITDFGKIEFKDGFYNGYNTRYFNFNDGTGRSLDYSIKDNKLLISTSKASMYELIDNLNNL